MKAKFIRPNHNTSMARVFVAITTPQSNLDIVDCDSDNSRWLWVDETTCGSCTSNIENTCTANPNDTCVWGYHVSYDNLSPLQKDSVCRSVYLKNIPKPD